MKKADLKTGMILVTGDGRKGMVLLGTKNGDIVSGKTWFPLSDTSDVEMFEECGGEYFIKAIYQPIGNCDFLLDGNLDLRGCVRIWTYQEPKEMTVEEIQQALGYKIKVVESK